MFLKQTDSNRSFLNIREHLSKLIFRLLLIYLLIHFSLIPVQKIWYSEKQFLIRFLFVCSMHLCLLHQHLFVLYEIPLVFPPEVAYMEFPFWGRLCRSLSDAGQTIQAKPPDPLPYLSLIHISEPTRLGM